MFDRYIQNVLSTMRLGWCLTDIYSNERSKGKTSAHRINDQTVIKNILLKELLSDIRTKSELTSYLAEKAFAHSKSHSNRLKTFLVTYQTYTLGNIDVLECLRSHDHEDADTLLLLHASIIVIMFVYASDTDIFLQIINAYEELPKNTVFVSRTSTTAVSESYKYLGKEKANAIIPFFLFSFFAFSYTLFNYYLRIL